MSGPEQPTPSFPSASQPHPAAGGAAAVPGENARNATVSLVLGILGLIICPIVCSPLAIMYGKRAKDEIRSRPGLGGEGAASAGVILGWIGLALVVVGVLVFVISLVAAS